MGARKHIISSGLLSRSALTALLLTSPTQAFAQFDNIQVPPVGGRVCVETPGVPCPGGDSASTWQDHEPQEPTQEEIDRQQAIEINDQALILLAQKRVHEAIAMLERARQLDRRNRTIARNLDFARATLLNNEGVDLGNAGRYSEAIAKLEAALRLYPNDKVTKSNLEFYRAVQLSAQKKYSQSLQSFLRSIQANKANEKNIRAAMRNVGIGVNADGVTRFRIGDFRGAIAFFKMAMDFDKASKAFRTNLTMSEAFLAGETGDYAGAAKKLNQMLKSDPGEAVQVQEARTSIAKMASEKGDNALKNGDRKAAESYYRKALALNPADSHSSSALAQLQALAGNSGKIPMPAAPQCVATPGVPCPGASSPSGNATVAGAGGNSASPGTAQPSGGASPKPTAGQPSGGLGIRPPDYQPLQQSGAIVPVSQAACDAGKEEAQAALRANDLPHALLRLRAILPQCPVMTDRNMVADRILQIEQEISERKKRAGYPSVAKGLVGGTAWMFDTYFREVAAGLTATERVEADIRYRARLRLAGIPEETYVAIKDYDFIIGLAASSNFLTDLDLRVLNDRDSLGRFTKFNHVQYDALKGHHFETLDCHSNGAMICLAALLSGDITADRVRILGPQITHQAAMDWRSMLDRHGLGNKIQSLEIIISDGDPVPPLSFYSLKDYTSDAPLNRSHLLGENLESDLSDGSCRMDGLWGCYSVPIPRITWLNCPDKAFSASPGCHYYSHYRSELDALERKQAQ